MKYIVRIILLIVVSVSFTNVAIANPIKEWTFLVFMNADNDLDQYGVIDQNEMIEGGGSNDWRNVICLIDRENGPAVTSYIGTSLTTIKEHGEVDMGDYKFFANWVIEMTAKYPAKHYFVTIWNHGSGWRDANGGLIRGISYDHTSHTHITNAQLTLATNMINKKLGKKIDILCFDACLMQMVEVMYAVKDGCDFLIASEESIPAEGFPYNDILMSFKKNTSPRNFSNDIVVHFTESYNWGSAGIDTTTMTAIECNKLEAVFNAINTFAKILLKMNFTNDIQTARSRVQKYFFKTNIDLIHLVERLKITITDENFLQAADSLIKACKNAVVRNKYSGNGCRNSHGFAIYFPKSFENYTNDYSKIAFTRALPWDEVLNKYYKEINVSQIIADLKHGNITSLTKYVRIASEKNIEISKYLTSKVNFRAFAEHDLDETTKANIKNLLKELNAK